MLQCNFWCSMSIKNTYFASKWIRIKFFVGTCEFVKNIIFSHELRMLHINFQWWTCLMSFCCYIIVLSIILSYSVASSLSKILKKLPKFWDRKLFFQGGYEHIHVYWLHIKEFLKKSCELSRIFFGKLCHQLSQNLSSDACHSGSIRELKKNSFLLSRFLKRPLISGLYFNWSYICICLKL